MSDATEKRASEVLAKRVKAALDEITYIFASVRSHADFLPVGFEALRPGVGVGVPDTKRGQRLLRGFREAFERVEADEEGVFKGKVVGYFQWEVLDREAVVFTWGCDDAGSLGAVEVFVATDGCVVVKSAHGCFQAEASIEGDPDDPADAVRRMVLLAFAGLMQLDGWT